MQSIIQLTNEFFELNDIKINGKKSELLVINSPIDTKDRHVVMGCDNHTVLAAKKHEPIRYLGVYFREATTNKHINERINNELKDARNLLIWKKITLAHVVYINNSYQEVLELDVYLINNQRSDAHYFLRCTLLIYI